MMRLSRLRRSAGAGRASRLVALACALALLAWPPAQAEALPEPAGIVSVEQADEALARVAVAREEAAEHRYQSLLACAERLWVNRCRVAVETEHRRARERFAALERRAREVLREARNLERNQALAERLALAREHFGNQPHRRPLATPGQERREAP